MTTQTTLGQIKIANQIGYEAATLKFNGASDAEVKAFVTSELSEFSDDSLIKLARQGYADMRNRLQNVKPIAGYKLTLNWDNDLSFVRN